MRDLSAGMTTALTQPVVRPVLIGRFDIESDPVVAWTGPGIFAPVGSGDSALDGQTFLPMLPVYEISDIIEDQGIGGPVTIRLAGHDLDETALRQVVRDKRRWRGRKAWLWIGLLNEDEKSVIAYPTRIKTGVMTSMITRRGVQTAEVEVTVDVDLGGARGAPWRWTDHARIYPTDTWSAYIVRLANRPAGLESGSLAGSGGAGGDNNAGSGMRPF